MTTCTTLNLWVEGDGDIEVHFRHTPLLFHLSLFSGHCSYSPRTARETPLHGLVARSFLLLLQCSMLKSHTLQQTQIRLDCHRELLILSGAVGDTRFQPYFSNLFHSLAASYCRRFHFQQNDELIIHLVIFHPIRPLGYLALVRLDISFLNEARSCASSALCIFSEPLSVQQDLLSVLRQNIFWDV